MTKCLRAQICGVGSYLPEKIITNHDLEKLVDTTHEWIVQRTGIESRRQTADGQATSDLATEAAKAALKDANMVADDIDMIIVATTTPDYVFPATAAIVQQKLGMTKGAAFDIQAVCAGFIYSLNLSDCIIQAGKAKNIIVIGAESISRLLDYSDRTTSVLFGDGAGAVVIKAVEGEGTNDDRAILSTCLHTDGRFADILKATGGVGSGKGQKQALIMDGPEVFKHAVEKLCSALMEVIQEAGVDANDIDWIVPHQANKRIIDMTAKMLKLPSEKVILTLDHHANTSAASIPLALDEAKRQGKVKQGDMVLFDAIGGGLSWGAALVRM